ncbi:hypothetical protein SDC9_132577 [bioreactor metagenome]|uniref:Uncharacterized protein n=1 Tax=bioreactor metagenome TaxID=1076179 RepID=A0A645D803_9ZZZZ
MLKDRKDVVFPLLPDCRQCVCQILNSKPLFTLKFYDEILETPTGSVRLDFTKESPFETAEIARAYVTLTADCKHPDEQASAFLFKMSKKAVTKGHFFRGVE